MSFGAGLSQPGLGATLLSGSKELSQSEKPKQPETEKESKPSGGGFFGDVFNMGKSVLNGAKAFGEQAVEGAKALGKDAVAGAKAVGNWVDKNKDLVKDIGHTALDIAGFIPVIGTAADLVNAGWYAAEGRYAEAAASAMSAVPGVGDAFAAGKMGVKLATTAPKVMKTITTASHLAPMAPALFQAGEAAVQGDFTQAALTAGSAFVPALGGKAGQKLLNKADDSGSKVQAFVGNVLNRGSGAAPNAIGATQVHQAYEAHQNGEGSGWEVAKSVMYAGAPFAFGRGGKKPHTNEPQTTGKTHQPETRDTSPLEPVAKDKEVRQAVPRQTDAPVQEHRQTRTEQEVRVTAQEPAFSERGYRPQPGERSMTKAKYKIQSSAERNFPGKQTEMNCAPQSCQQVIRASNGRNLSEVEMAASAKTSANYDSQKGTIVTKVPNVLKAEGVKATNMPNKPENIQTALAEGKGVVSSHDAGKLWGNNAQGGHAVHVTGVKKNANGEITHYVINDTGTGQVARQVTAEQYEGSLLKAPATVTEKPISYGGSTAKAQRRADAKTQKAEEAETTSKSETTGSKMTEAEATQETATLGSKKAKTGGESEPKGNAPKSSATNESAALQRNTDEKDFTNVSSQNDTPESREISETISAPVRELYGRQPNREFNRSAIRRIKKNMQQEGFDPDSPIRVAEIDGRKIIIDGHHRARAAGAAGIKNVPVIIEEISPEKASLYGQHAAEASQSLGLDYRWYNPYAPKPY